MPKTNLKRAVNEFLRYMASLNRTQNTLVTYQRVLGRFCRFLEKRFLVEHTGQLKESMVEAYMFHLHEKGNMGKTRRSNLCAIKSFSKYLFMKKHTKTDIAYCVALPKAEKTKRMWLREEKIRETLNYLLSDQHPSRDFFANLRDHVLIRLLYVTGIRINEAMTIDPTKDIHWETRSIDIEGKGRKQRTVYADAATLEVLRLFLQEQNKRIPNGHRLFYAESRNPASYETLKRAIKRHLGVTPHILRHSFATNLRLRGMEIDALAELMGHECLETTRIYATLANDELQRRYHECGLLTIPNGPAQKPVVTATASVDSGLDIERVRRRLNGKRPH